MNLAYVDSSFFAFCSRGVTRAKYSLMLSDLESRALWLLLGVGAVAGAVVERRRERMLRSPRDRIAADETWVLFLEPGWAASLAPGPTWLTESVDGLPLLSIVVRKRVVRTVLRAAFGYFFCRWYCVLLCFGGGE